MPTERKGQRGGSNESQRSENEDLKRREYRDEQGNIHHHTHEYMKQHGDKKKE